MAGSGDMTRSTIRIQVRIHRIHMFLGLPDPDPLVRGTYGSGSVPGSGTLIYLPERRRAEWPAPATWPAQRSESGSGSTESTCFWASRIRIHQSKVWIRIRILLLSWIRNTDHLLPERRRAGWPAPATWPARRSESGSGSTESTCFGPPGSGSTSQRYGSGSVPGSGTMIIYLNGGELRGRLRRHGPLHDPNPDPDPSIMDPEH